MTADCLLMDVGILVGGGMAEQKWTSLTAQTFGPGQQVLLELSQKSVQMFQRRTAARCLLIGVAEDLQDVTNTLTPVARQDHARAHQLHLIHVRPRLPLHVQDVTSLLLSPYLMDMLSSRKFSKHDAVLNQKQKPNIHQSIMAKAFSISFIIQISRYSFIPKAFQSDPASRSFVSFAPPYYAVCDAYEQPE